MLNKSPGFRKTLQDLSLGDGWEWHNGSWWLTSLDPPDMRETTERMRDIGARFVAITALQRADSEIRLDYQWDLNGQLLTYVAATRSRKIATIADLSPAADWAERETHEYFAVDFTGRESTPPLMIRAGDSIGINLHREVDE